MDDKTVARPVVAEVVPSPPPQPGRLLAMLLALTPLMARLCWWWWSQGRSGRQPPPSSGATLIEHTDVEMVKRRFGRWRITISNTRWVSQEPPPGGAQDSGRRHWTRTVAALVSLGLAGRSQASPGLGAPPVPLRLQRGSGESERP